MRNVIQSITDIYRECGSSTPFWAQVPGAQVQELEILEVADLAEMNEEERKEYIRAVQREASNLWHGRVHGKKLVEMVKSLPHVKDLTERVAALTEPALSEEHCMSRQVGLSTTFTTREFTCCSSYLICHLLMCFANSHWHLQQAPHDSCFAFPCHAHVGPSFGSHRRSSVPQPQDVGYLRLPRYSLW